MLMTLAKAFRTGVDRKKSQPDLKDRQSLLKVDTAESLAGKESSTWDWTPEDAFLT
ncbi:hypothetical protein ANO11243_014750 [Dothideomycetidae sp. 11243]|nr:hypothetical protein ANO11243_014750 [fungal sp. No.11243]